MREKPRTDKTESSHIDKNISDHHRRKKSKYILTGRDYELLREHLRLCNNMKTKKPRKSFRNDSSLKCMQRPNIVPRMNKTVELRSDYNTTRKLCGQQKKRNNEQDTVKLEKLARNVKKMKSSEVRTNLANKMKWKHARKIPVFTDNFKKSFDMYGKPPFVGPLKHLPMNAKKDPYLIRYPPDWIEKEKQ